MLISSTTITSLTALNSMFRLPLAAMVSLTAFTGVLAADPGAPGLLLWSVGWGIFLLSAACSVLNQVQERITDALMTRTRHRPIACGLIEPRIGATIGLLLGSSGLILLSVGSGQISALLGLATMAWYLLIYTPLKRISSLAVIAGTPCGALPPLIGWQAASGELFSPQILAIALIMLLWQVPHFWLLAMPDRDELRLAGFKVLPATLSNQKLLHICHFWIMGLSSVTLLLPLLHLLWQPLLQGALAGLALTFAIWASFVQRKVLFVEKAARKLRFGLHLYLGLVLCILLLQGMLFRYAI